MDQRIRPRLHERIHANMLPGDPMRPPYLCILFIKRVTAVSVYPRYTIVSIAIRPFLLFNFVAKYGSSWYDSKVSTQKDIRP